jgi:hypothetical protein
MVLACIAGKDPFGSRILIAVNNHPMKQLTFLNLFATALCLTVHPTAFGQTSAGSMLYSPNLNLSSGSQNGFAGTVGGIFLTTYSFYPQVNWLGYYDANGDGLANSHVVTLWDNTTQGVIGTTTVPAGTAAPLVGGYRWAPLSSTITLNYGSYYAIAAQTDGTDLWGDLIANNSPDNGNNGQITWNPEYVQLGSGWEFTRAGRYDVSGNYPAEPPNQVGSNAIYPVANLGFDIVVVPEPTILSFLGLGAGMLLISMRKRGARVLLGELPFHRRFFLLGFDSRKSRTPLV